MHLAQGAAETQVGALGAAAAVWRRRGVHRGGAHLLRQLLHPRQLHVLRLLLSRCRSNHMAPRDLLLQSALSISSAPFLLPDQKPMDIFYSQVISRNKRPIQSPP